MIPVLRYAAIGNGPAPRDRPWTIRSDVFADHLRAIVATGRVPITAARLGDLIRSGTPTPHAVVVTFDGGSGGFREAALRARDSGVVSTVFVATGWLSRPGRLERRELRLLAAAGVEIGAAGHTYRRFDELSPTDQRAEAQRSRDELADILGHEPTAFAYPHGAHDASARAAVRAVGYPCAFATGERSARTDDDVLAIGRLTVRAVTSTRTLGSWLAPDQPAAASLARPQPAREPVLAAAVRLVRRPWTTRNRPGGHGRPPVTAAGARTEARAGRTGRPVPGAGPDERAAPSRVPAQTAGPGNAPGGVADGRPLVTLELPDQVSPPAPATPEVATPADQGGAHRS